MRAVRMNQNNKKNVGQTEKQLAETQYKALWSPEKLQF